MAFSHAMQHGQAATEDLLRNGKEARPAGHEMAELLKQILEFLVTNEHRAAAAIRRLALRADCAIRPVGPSG